MTPHVAMPIDNKEYVWSSKLGEKCVDRPIRVMGGGQLMVVYLALVLSGHYTGTVD
jgi:hypothetical protein